MTTTYKDYNEYLESPKWKQVKADFFRNYEGSTEICQVSGMPRRNPWFKKDQELHLHHWKYPSDLNDDSWTNLILIHHCVHRFLHGKKEFTIDYHSEFKGREDINTRTKYVQVTARMWCLTVAEEAEDRINTHWDLGWCIGGTI